MSPLNRGALVGPRVPPPMRQPMARYGRPPLPGMGARGMPPPPPMNLMNQMYMARHGPIPPPPPRPGHMMVRPGGPPVAPPMFRGRPMPPIPPMVHMGMHGPMGPRDGHMMRPGHRGVLPPHALPHMRPRFPPHMNGKGKPTNNKKNNKHEELELKKPWMTDEIRKEIQRKNKLYAKAKKNKDAKEWEEFKDLRNKVTRMIRDAKNEYLQKNPDQAHLYESDDESEENDNDDEFYSDSEEESTENIDAYCEVCDREFPSQEMLERHIQEHQTCNIDGCTFTAHPKIVEKHISMQHCTGLYSRMKNLMSDGDIDKWRAERKRRYPTAANTKLKESEQVEKEKRGEVIKSNQNKKNQRPPKKDTRKNRKRKHNKAFKTKIEQTEKIIEKQTFRGLLPFAGTAMLDKTEQSDHSSVEEYVVNSVVEDKIEASDKEENVTEQKFNDVKLQPEVLKKSVDETPTVKDVAPLMLSLVADYESDSDNDEPPEEVPIKKLKSDEDETFKLAESQIKVEGINSLPNNTDVLKSLSTSICDSREENSSTVVENHLQSKVDTKDLPVSTCDKKTISAKNREKGYEKAVDKNKKKVFEDKKKFNRNKPNNVDISDASLGLLNKLLARSIQHERNTIFQCIKFIANNNFFD